MTRFLKERAEKAPGNKPAELPTEGEKVGAISGLVDRFTGLVHPPYEVKEPAKRDRISARWWAVQYHPVEESDGRTTPVVCFSCNAIFSGRWALRYSAKGPELRPLVGGGLVNIGGALHACPCDAGAAWRSTFKAATLEQCRAIEALAIEDLNGGTHEKKT